MSCECETDDGVRGFINTQNDKVVERGFLATQHMLGV